MAGYISETLGERVWISSISLNVGESRTLYYYHSDVMLYEYIRGSSSDTGVASLSLGSYQDVSWIPFTVTAVGGGSTTIRVYCGPTDMAARRATLTVNVADVDLDLEVSPSGNPNIAVGETTTLTITASPSGLPSYEWELLQTADDDNIEASLSSSGNKATLRITGVSAGSDQVQVKCTAGGKSLSVLVLTYVTEDESQVAQIRITPSTSVSVDSGDQVTLVATTSPTDASNRHVNWTKVNGSSYFDIDTEDTSTGGRCIITAHDNITVARSCSVRATAADGGGATATKQFTINPIEVISMPSSIVVGVGETVNLRAVFSTTLSWDYGISPMSIATAECISSFNGGAVFAITGVSAGTATFEIQYQQNGTKTKTCTVNVRGSTPVDPDEPDLVSSIDIQAPSGTEVQVGKNLSVSAFAYPTSAENRRLDATIRSGTQYAEVVSTSTSSTGGSILIKGISPGNVIIRFTARDDGGYYDEITVTVVEATTLCTSVIIYNRGVRASDSIITETETNVGKTVDVFPGGDPSWASDTTVNHQVRSGASLISIELIDDDVHGSIGLSQYRITGLGVGTAVVRFTANDGSGEYADLTVNIGHRLNDDYPSNYSKTIRLDMFEDAAKHGGNGLDDRLSSAPPYKLHGGYLGVDLPEGLYVFDGMSAGEFTTIPSAANSDITSTRASYSLQGAATEPGEVWVYVENADGEVEQTHIIVEAAGLFTKTVRFDANVPTGAQSTGSVPDSMVQEYTGAIANFTIPQCDLAVEGYVRIGWRTSPDDDGDGKVYDAGDRFVVTGDEVTATLYAEWFPIPEGATGSGTSSDPFTWQHQTYDVVSHTVPNKGDYDILTGRYDGELPEGITAQIGMTAYSNYPSTATFGTGSIVVSGTPTTVSDLVFWQYGQRHYYVYFRIIVAEGEVPEPDEDLLVTFDANGGTFANGQETVTITAPDRVYVLPDWSVVDRPGYRLSHWTDAGGNRSEMGQRKNTIETWTANWVRDERDYDTAFLPHASVRIYRALDEYIDVTYMQVQGGEVSVQVAENQAGMASFTLINEYITPERSILSEDCDLWSSGSPGPIRTGMYVRIDDIGEDGNLSYLMDGFVTTISPNAETVDIQVGDRITFLSKSGSTYRRNFYGDSRTSGIFDAGHDGEGFYGDLSDMPSEALVDGDPFWKVRSTSSYNGDRERSVMGFGNSLGDSCSIRIPFSGVDRLESIRLRLGFRGRNMPETYSFSGVARITSGGNSWFELWSASYTNMGTLHTMDLTLTFWNGDTSGIDIVGGEATLELELTGHSGGGYGSVILMIGDSGPFDVSYGGTTIEGTSLDMDVTTGNWEQVTEYELSSDGRLDVTAIDNVTDMDDETLWTPAEDRVRVAYVTGSQSTVSMMESMSWAFGMTPIVAGTPDDAELRMFRTGGGYALDYYQKLADVPAQSGRRRAFSVRGYTTPFIVLSPRHRLSDTPSAHIHYGGDSVTGSEERIAFASFSPSLTFKNRPNLIMVRGTMSSKGQMDSTPIMVAVEDSDSTDRRYGLVVEDVIADGQVNMAIDAANSAWAELSGSDLDEWEGSVTIPGIRRDLLPATGTYAGSGVALLITDSRNGLKECAVRARELRIDYSQCTTTVVLTNHSMVYSSGISDTAALAITSADVATGANDTTLFNTQYVRVRTDQAQAVRESGNEVRGRLVNSQIFEFDDVSILRLPSGRNVLVASAPSGGNIHAPAESSYAVVEVRLNDGAGIAINPSIRPDYYDGQLLILNLDFPSV